MSTAMDKTTVPSAYASATTWLEHLRDGRLSARDALEAHIDRLGRVNPALNAVVALDLDAARRRADEADAARRRGEDWGPLHGLPLTIKDTWEVAGMVCAAGSPTFRSHRPAQTAPGVQRLIDAGAIVYGKTNVPDMALDIQSYNAVYGTSRNPWNPALTPGGSSGGAAAAVATGLTPLELGSDIGGSIRIPAHFCGVYGHKSTYGIVPMRGHIPVEPGHVSEPPLCVAGPLARSADDLRLVLDVVAGPGPDRQPGWALTLPEPRRAALADFKVLMWVDDPDCAIDPRMADIYRVLGRQLQAAGAQVSWGAPLGMGLKDFYPCYTAQMGGLMKALLSPAERRSRGMVAPFGRATAALMKGLGRVASLPQHIDRFVAGLGMTPAEWLEQAEQGARLAEAFRAVFQQYDVILAPPTMGPAFEHDHSLFAMRRLKVGGRTRHYADQFMWIAPATLMGLPATSAPVGRTADGLPVNVQIIGAPYEDKTTIHFAGLLSQVGSGFTPPPEH